MSRLFYDLKYILLNMIVNRIPCWTIRRLLYIGAGVTIGKNSRIGLYTVIIEPSKIVIGDRTIVNEFCYLDGRGGLVIGNDTSISPYSMFITASHRHNSDDFSFFSEKTVVGNHVWLGVKALVLNGSTINDGAIIGAGCVFKGFADKNEIWVGNPAVKKTQRILVDKYEINYNPFFR